MRVVAHFKDQPDRPHVAQAMVRTGQICEQVGDVAGARAIYNQLVQQYPDDPNAPAARAALDRLMQQTTTTKTSPPR
jgi:TolA-binding protein